MKIATIINPIKSVQVNIILDKTIFASNINLVSDNKRFVPTDNFFDFVSDMVGDNLGKKDNCYVICLDLDNEETLINPMSFIINKLIEQDKKQ